MTYRVSASPSAHPLQVLLMPWVGDQHELSTLLGHSAGQIMPYASGGSSQQNYNQKFSWLRSQDLVRRCGARGSSCAHDPSLCTPSVKTMELQCTTPVLLARSFNADMVVF